MLIILLIGGVLVWQLLTFFEGPGPVDWLLFGLLFVTTGIFMGLGVFLLDFEQKMVLARDGIYIMPAVFSAYKIAWDDIELLELRDGNGFRLIEYRLKKASPTYQNRIAREGEKKFLNTEGRNGGFHGAIPVMAFTTDISPRAADQLNLRANRLFPILFRFWQNQLARVELPVADLDIKNR